MTETEQLLHELRNWVVWLNRKGPYQPKNLIDTLQRVIDHLEAMCAATPATTETQAESPPGCND